MQNPGRVALLLQGGGALASYQAGVYEGLDGVGIDPCWVVGTSSGALNAAIIAGNPPAVRVEKLRSFWNMLSRSAMGCSGAFFAAQAFTKGLVGFYRTKTIPMCLQRCYGNKFESWYDVSPLRTTLRDLVDFDRLNDPAQMRVSIGVVNVRTARHTYFDNTRVRLTPEHFLATCALPPGFEPVEIEGEYYWDGGMVSNTPLECLLDAHPTDELVAVQADVWCARGEVPSDMMAVGAVMQDIQFSSKADIIEARLHDMEQAQRLVRDLMDLVPSSRLKLPACVEAFRYLKKRISLIDLTYRNKPCDTYFRTFDFSETALRCNWQNGLEAMTRALPRLS